VLFDRKSLDVISSLQNSETCEKLVIVSVWDVLTLEEAISSKRSLSSAEINTLIHMKLLQVIANENERVSEPGAAAVFIYSLSEVFPPYMSPHIFK
jgi:hypothetical protein